MGTVLQEWKGKQLFKLGDAGDTKLKDNNITIFLMLKNSKKKNLREKHIINCAFRPQVTDVFKEGWAISTGEISIIE